MSEKHRVLSPQEKAKIQNEKQRNEKLLESSEKYSKDSLSLMVDGDILDKDKIRQRIRHLNKVLEECSMQKENDPVKRDKILAERKRIESIIKPYITTYREDKTTDRTSPDFKLAKEKTLKLSSYEYQKLVERWRDLGAMLDPDDPKLRDITALKVLR